MKALFLVIFAYLLGSITFGEVIAKLKGVDLRNVGSGNVGATNVTRALGKKYGVLVFFLDFLKGFIPALIAVKSFGIDSWVLTFTGLASVLGHMYPVFFGFKGGKGVATALGVVFAVSPSVALFSFLVWLGIFLWKRYVSLASITATISAFLFLFVAGYPVNVLFMAIVIGALIIYRHRENINRLLTGREHRF
ncbi:glycerol-3-phosphate 1-O-acyltransferase PlsY [Aquifex aeolicus]|uniref:Glycerol-3-phosphate acyltransferase n=1 Tax=Aquifex aeolicus (strain VF5) TaxID=224324 RepID=PLSY_AQUAE|nr:glycerol-3-phosphate 1-O-acyltransferase PlsY [Aquifex aeolicus]O66905.1 RecName: Full=Glycerol-3-phosphate acyltransferase; AltName: Full=Acyl-PO4 G3P acyltransferase; AltName: Full=Acyl-phosphate--glycerol-3-phosphate acyltransferase; AltName: Full=G3P acyltransferase; Short=GPAT; AltName: Full=Lysophosphatidic acid synthase; Short=LPA synthase [Aquifex aeolicus VF5]AAC06869.1 hypothetical protein aq_676 [Aquifex aeolicus VF5]